jgi:hypothetical protein
MSAALRRLLFESSPWGPFWSAILVGFAAVGFDGRVYLTDAGSAYLESVA